MKNSIRVNSVTISHKLCAAKFQALVVHYSAFICSLTSKCMFDPKLSADTQFVACDLRYN